MSREWREARDARVVELKRRQAKCLFGQNPQQNTIIEVKALLLQGMDSLQSGHSLKALISLKKAFDIFRELPEPTKENTWHPNSHRMIEVRDWFFTKCKLDSHRLNFIRIPVNFIIDVYDYDPPYRDILDDVKVEIESKSWAPKGSLDLIAHDWKWWPND